jgi:hypothetical protein
MAIFDSNKRMYLTFYVGLTDPDLVAQYQAQYPETAPLNVAPYSPGPPAGGAAVQFAAPWRGYQQPAASQAPFSWTPWSGEGEQDGPYPLNVASFSRHTGGFLGMGGTTVKYYWIGQFVLAADGDATTDSGITITARTGIRKWIDGFELPNAASGSFGNTGGCYPSPDASRHVGGLGLALRGATAQYTQTWTAYGAAVSAVGWERFYFRLRQLPSASTFFWNTSTAPSASLGTLLAITASGQIAVYTSDAGGTKTLVQVISDSDLVNPITVWDGTVDDDAWHRIDIFQQCSGTPFFVMLIDGHSVLGTAVPPTFTGTAGAVNATSFTSSKFGPADAVANDLYMDVDDWMGSAIPVQDADGVTLDLNSRDFVNGTKVVRCSPTVFNAGHSVNWTGDVRVVRLNNCGIAVSTPASLASSTALAMAAVDTDGSLAVDADAGSLGAASFRVSMMGTKGLTANGKLGYSINGAADVMATVTQSTTLSAASVMWSNSAKNFTDITPLVLKHEKGNEANAAVLAQLHAEVELIGHWNACDYNPLELEDLPQTPTFSGSGVHNRPYPRSPWALVGAAPPISPYIVKAGTYVGNDTGQDLTFRAPVHTIFIRPLTGNTGGTWWMSTMLGSHRNNQEGITALLAAEEDPTFNGAPGADSQTVQYRIRVAGNSSQINAVGVTFQYIAIMDPGMRFGMGVALNHKATLGPRTWPLINSTFTPQFALLQAENASSTSTNRLYSKSSGNAASGITPWNAAAEITSALTFGAGTVITDVNLHAIAGFNHGMMLWRKSDGNNDAGEPGVVNFGSYIGDGSASRTINLSPASGRRPLFVMVFGTSGTNRHRDPSHTGSNSSSNAGVEATTGITSGGIDQFSVGSGLNTNAIVYTYFVLFADATACNNGWGCNGEYAPVDPNSPAGSGGPWPPPGTFPEPGTVPPPPPDTEGPTPDPDDPSPDFDADCIDATTAIVNRALHRIGISKRISNVGTDLGIEASVARTNWGLDVNQTLRDHPWSFATRYADLVLVAGTALVPANKDWQYSYRAPADMLFARRIVNQAGEKRDWDRDPIKFRLGSDSTGGLIYTDAAITVATNETIPVQLEYTIRVNCPASRGDALFRDALVWRHAASIAAPLTRDLKKMQWAQAMYEQVILKAKTADVQEQQQAKEGDVDWIDGRN